jgi:hypothetical protein
MRQDTSELLVNLGKMSGGPEKEEVRQTLMVEDAAIANINYRRSPLDPLLEAEEEADEVPVMATTVKHCEDILELLMPIIEETNDSESSKVFACNEPLAVNEPNDSVETTTEMVHLTVDNTPDQVGPSGDVAIKEPMDLNGNLMETTFIIEKIGAEVINPQQNVVTGEEIYQVETPEEIKEIPLETEQSLIIEEIEADDHLQYSGGQKVWSSVINYIWTRIVKSLFHYFQNETEELIEPLITEDKEIVIDCDENGNRAAVAVLPTVTMTLDELREYTENVIGNTIWNIGKDEFIQKALVKKFMDEKFPEVLNRSTKFPRVTRV